MSFGVCAALRNSFGCLSHAPTSLQVRSRPCGWNPAEVSRCVASQRRSEGQLAMLGFDITTSRKAEDRLSSAGIKDDHGVGVIVRTCEPRVLSGIDELVNAR